MDGRKQIMSPAMHSFAEFSVASLFCVAHCHLRFLLAWPYLRNTVNDFAA